MPVRATKRGSERTPLGGEYDVVICGASFAGLAVARELAGSDARILIVDRYEIGERQTSACAAPTEWLENLGLGASIRQTFRDLVVHRPSKTHPWTLPWSFSTFHYRQLCELLAEQGDFTFDTAKVDGITRGAVHTVHTDRGDLRAPLVVDALGWRRVLSEKADAIQPPEARLSRGLEVHPPATGDDLELWLDPKYIVPGYSWAFPAGDELRTGVGSFDPRLHAKHPPAQLAGALGTAPAGGSRGTWTPPRLRPAVGDGVFFAGDSAGHCLPTTAEGIRTALYFGIACGRELRAVHAGAKSREQALADYAAFSAAHARPFRLLKRAQDLVGHVVPREWLLRAVLRAMSRRRLVDWFFAKYLAVAPPEFALGSDGPPVQGHPAPATDASRALASGRRAAG